MLSQVLSPGSTLKKLNTLTSSHAAEKASEAVSPGASLPAAAFMIAASWLCRPWVTAPVPDRAPRPRKLAEVGHAYGRPREGDVVRIEHLHGPKDYVSACDPGLSGVDNPLRCKQVDVPGRGGRDAQSPERM